jgi:hypothetical protein
MHIPFGKLHRPYLQKYLLPFKFAQPVKIKSKHYYNSWFFF